MKQKFAAPRPRPRRPAARGARRGAGPIVAALLAAGLIAGIALLVVVDRRAGRPAPSGQPAQQTARTILPPGAETAHVAGILVDRASVDQGRVPLDTPVTQTFRLHNVGDELVSLGRARVEVLEGC
jgi:hypothetical protein